jgi:hypothetical protein
LYAIFRGQIGRDTPPDKIDTTDENNLGKKLKFIIFLQKIVFLWSFTMAIGGQFRQSRKMEMILLFLVNPKMIHYSMVKF